ncbi:MAG TPA: hypothetical protein VGK74_07520 [Symbiobacteriaceae bacterium]
MSTPRRSAKDARLKQIQATDDENVLIEALADLSPVVVEAAARRVSKHRAGGALARAFERLDEGAPASDPGCWARMAILEALGRLESLEGEEPAFRAVRAVQVEPVSGGLTDTATGLRVAGASLLANLRPPGALLDLAWLLHDFEPNATCSRQERPFAKLATRQAAARAIGALGDPAGAAVVAVKLAFPGEELPDVLAECMDALAALREPRAVELLTPYLDRRDPYLVAAAGAAIATAGGERVVPLLVAALERVPAEAQEALVYAIGSIRADAAHTALQELTRHPDPVISKAAKALTE